MNNIRIITDNKFDWENYDQVDTDDDLYNLGSANIVKSLLIGSAVFFLFTSEVHANQFQQFDIFSKIPVSTSQSIQNDLVNYSAELSKLEKDISAVASASNIFPADAFIDSEELKEEKEVVTNYMQNVRQYYKFHAKRINFRK